MKKRLTFTLTILGTLISSHVFGLWGINTLTNNSEVPVHVKKTYTQGEYKDLSSKIGINGNVFIEVVGYGAIYFKDMGHNTDCEYPHWGVSISYNDQTWGFYYDGGGLIDVTINEDGTATFKAVSGGSQLIKGDGKPKCSK